MLRLLEVQILARKIISLVCTINQNVRLLYANQEEPEMTNFSGLLFWMPKYFIKIVSIPNNVILIVVIPRNDY